MELERIGPYRIVRKLGQGGTGTVYEAVHEEIARSVAIKVLRGHGGSRPELTARFLNEARAVNIIRHRSIVGISDLGRLPDGSPYIVMEHLDGVTLRRRAAAGLPLPSLLRLCRQVASALAAAHDKGIIHRVLELSSGTRAEAVRWCAKWLSVLGLRADRLLPGAYDVHSRFWERIPEVDVPGLDLTHTCPLVLEVPDVELALELMSV